ncbi:M14 family zinc carboxypeptidase [Adhaeretor mobilis]|uniref:Zinc carboxypeptidase n=1 Tax=Adhaeretor mobilis TaxID=1930276 RepID=A0A517N2V5_9BACT|nr:M14 family zinc carboxypeptidase [Adhaeretor mobilis]QDT01464.1 Zinc carboxypeptidase [Adhaeretor mobilis]
MLILVWLCVTASTGAAQTVLFSDDLSTSAGWRYSHFGGTNKPDSSDTSDADFGFNYSQFGIPEAPNSAPGDVGTSGLRLAVNVPGLWRGDQVAAVYEDAAFAGPYTVQVDVWANWVAPSGSGSTEHVGVLAGFQVDDAQNTFSPGQNGAGVIYSTDGDASCGGECDFALVKDGAHLDLASGQYGESDIHSENQPGYNNTNANDNVDLENLFPSFSIESATSNMNATGTQPAGALGFQWVTVTLEVDPTAPGSGAGSAVGTVRVTLESHQSGNSLVLGTINNSVINDPNDGFNAEEQSVNLEGGIGLMMTDLYASAASDSSLAFGLFDNVRVYQGLVDPLAAQAQSPAVVVPEPTSATILLSAVALVVVSLRRTRSMLMLVLLAFATITASPAQAQLNLFANFDHGALQSWSGDLNNISLVGRENHPFQDGWRWMYFQATGLDNAQPVFSIDQEFAGGNYALNSHAMVYSYDNENWQFFENNGRSGNLYTFSNNSAFTGDEVFVAYAQPYSYGRSAEHTATVLASPWAEPTVSGDANGVIGQTPLAFDDLDRLVPRKDIFAYRITNPATDSPTAKRKVVLTTGMHSGEVLGTHTYEGLINWLISDDVRAARLRDEVEFFAYPTLNAAGRFAGTSRATVENPDQDPNGLWNPSLWTTHEDIRANGEAMLADVASTPGTEVDVFIDFHSTIPSSAGNDFGFIEISEGDANAPWWQNLLALQPNVQQVESTGMNWTSANFADLLLNADVDVTFELEFGNNRPLSYYQELGESFGIAFYSDWIQVANPEAADFDEDGDVDEDDLSTWQDNYGLNGEATHFLGDANADTAVDGSDFLIWQQQLGSTPPAAQNVPEPSAIAFAAFTVLTLTLSGSRSRPAK